MSVATVSVPGTSLVGLRPARRVVARRRDASVDAAPAVALVPVVPPVAVGLPVWFAPQCRGDVLFPVLVAMTYTEMQVCLMASATTVKTRAGDLTLDDAVWLALTGLRALGSDPAVVRRLAASTERVNARFGDRMRRGDMPAGFWKDWSRERKDATGGLMAGEHRLDAASNLTSYIRFTGTLHDAPEYAQFITGGRCMARGLCRHCWPENFPPRDQTGAAARHDLAQVA